MRKGPLLLAMIFGALSSGCLSKQVAQDGVGVRQAMLDIYTDQIMDNLIRAKNNMPFVQLKYSSIQVNDVIDMSGNGTIDQSISTVRNLVIAGASRTVLKDYKEGVTGDFKRTMNFTADPVTDSNDVYDKYIDFAKKYMMVTEGKPPCSVHIMKKCGHKYYWVPCDAGEEFLKLCMETTFQRGPAPPPPAIAVANYAVTIASFDNIEDLRNPKDLDNLKKDPQYLDAMSGVIVFKEKTVPRGIASMIVTLGKRKVTLDLVEEDGPKKVLTNRFKVNISPKRDGFTLQQLVGLPANVYSREFPPETMPTPVPTEVMQINRNLNSILVQLQNQGKGK
jgi:hypothetical protein